MQIATSTKLCLIAISGGFILLGGCVQVPELDEAIPASIENAGYPALVPIETLLVPGTAAEESALSKRDDLIARRDSLQQRARQLDETIVDSETQERMKAGVGG